MFVDDLALVVEVLRAALHPLGRMEDRPDRVGARMGALDELEVDVSVAGEADEHHHLIHGELEFASHGSLRPDPARRA